MRHPASFRKDWSPPSSASSWSLGSEAHSLNAFAPSFLPASRPPVRTTARPPRSLSGSLHPHPPPLCTAPQAPPVPEPPVLLCVFAPSPPQHGSLCPHALPRLALANAQTALGSRVCLLPAPGGGGEGRGWLGARVLPSRGAHSLDGQGLGPLLEAAEQDSGPKGCREPSPTARRQTGRRKPREGQRPAKVTPRAGAGARPPGSPRPPVLDPTRRTRHLVTSKFLLFLAGAPAWESSRGAPGPRRGGTRSSTPPGPRPAGPQPTQTPLHAQRQGSGSRAGAQVTQHIQALTPGSGSRDPAAADLPGPQLWRGGPRARGRPAVLGGLSAVRHAGVTGGSGVRLQSCVVSASGICWGGWVCRCAGPALSGQWGRAGGGEPLEWPKEAISSLFLEAHNLLSGQVVRIETPFLGGFVPL